MKNGLAEKLCIKCNCFGKGYPKRGGNICKECCAKIEKTRRERKRDEINAQRRKYYSENTAKVLERNRKYQEENREKVREINRKYYHDNPEKRRSYQQTRRSRVKLQTPKWLTKKDYQKMEMLYTISKFIKNKTGVEMAVDHIIPLNGKFVSGFNMPENMQVITKIENERKGNYHESEKRR